MAITPSEVEQLKKIINGYYRKYWPILNIYTGEITAMKLQRDGTYKRKTLKQRKGRETTTGLKWEFFKFMVYTINLKTNNINPSKITEELPGLLETERAARVHMPERYGKLL